MKLTHFKKAILGALVISSFMSVSEVIANEKVVIKEGFIPQMMEQVHGKGFALTNKESSTALEISGSKLSTGPKILLTFYFGT